jgi:hypothetical protein
VNGVVNTHVRTVPLMIAQALEDMPSKFTLQELILVVINRDDIFEIRPMLDLFVKKTIPFVSIEEFAVSALVAAKYSIGINASRYLPNLQSWAFSSLPSESRPEPQMFATSEQQFDQEIESISLFVGIALLINQPNAVQATESSAGNPT